jgi:hypothetical protein
MYTTDENEGFYGNNPTTKMEYNGLPVSSDEWLEGNVYVKQWYCHHTCKKRERDSLTCSLRFSRPRKGDTKVKKTCNNIPPSKFVEEPVVCSTTTTIGTRKLPYLD